MDSAPYSPRSLFVCNDFRTLPPHPRARPLRRDPASRRLIRPVHLIQRPAPGPRDPTRYRAESDTKLPRDCAQSAPLLHTLDHHPPPLVSHLFLPTTRTPQNEKSITPISVQLTSEYGHLPDLGLLTLGR